MSSHGTDVYALAEAIGRFDALWDRVVRLQARRRGPSPELATAIEDLRLQGGVVAELLREHYPEVDLDTLDPELPDFAGGPASS